MYGVTKILGIQVKYITSCHEVHIKYMQSIILPQEFFKHSLDVLIFFSLTGWVQRLLCSQHHHLDSKECKWYSQKGWNYSWIISRRPWHREDSWQYPRSWHKSGKWNKVATLLFIFFSFMYHSVLILISWHHEDSSTKVRHLRLHISLTLWLYVQVYVIGGDGTQRGAGVIFEVSTTVDSLKVFSDLFEL